MLSNNTLERTAGSHTLAAAAHREHYAAYNARGPLEARGTGRLAGMRIPIERARPSSGFEADTEPSVVTATVRPGDGDSP